MYAQRALRDGPAAGRQGRARGTARRREASRRGDARVRDARGTATSRSARAGTWKRCSPTEPEQRAGAASDDAVRPGAGRSHEALARIDKAAESGPLTPPLILLRAQILASRQGLRARRRGGAPRLRGRAEPPRRAGAARQHLRGAEPARRGDRVVPGSRDGRRAAGVGTAAAGAPAQRGRDIATSAKALYEKVLADAQRSLRREERSRLAARRRRRRPRARTHARAGGPAGGAGERRDRRHRRLRVPQEGALSTRRWSSSSTPSSCPAARPTTPRSSGPSTTTTWGSR